MDAHATAKYVRISGRKVRRYSREIKNLPYREAHAYLTIIPAKGANILAEVLQSAVANLMAKSKNIDEDSIKVENIEVNQGPMLKRWIPRARGRADRIKKQTCHIAVTVSGEEVKK